MELNNNWGIDEDIDVIEKPNNRITDQWTDTLDEAFGATGTKGRLGEEFLLRVFEKWGWVTKYYPEDKQKQLAGIDIEFKKPRWDNFYSCDCKNNMTEFGTVYVHADWLFKIKSDRVFHVNPDTGWVMWYSVDEMRKVYDTSKDFMTIKAKERFSFMTSTRTEV